MNRPSSKLWRLAVQRRIHPPSALVGPPHIDPGRRVVRHRPPPMRIHQIACAPIRPRASQPTASTLRLIRTKIN